jgi:hypothetical protein
MSVSGRLEGHYTLLAPSEKLIQEWNRIITLKWMQEPDVSNSLAQDSTQQLIRNGIFFPEGIFSTPSQEASTEHSVSMSDPIATRCHPSKFE